MKVILATNYGTKTEVLVDEADYELVKNIGWHIDTKGYARAKISNKGKFMHRLIMGVTNPNIYVDHINGNPLDNRRENLRLATNSQNQANRQIHSTNTTGYRGVCWAKDTQKWQASIKVNRKSIYLGQYTNIEDAANAYKKAAEEYFGDFAEHKKVA
jgi:hypothetical protein